MDRSGAGGFYGWRIVAASFVHPLRQRRNRALHAGGLPAGARAGVRLEPRGHLGGDLHRGPGGRAPLAAGRPLDRSLGSAPRDEHRRAADGERLPAPQPDGLAVADVRVQPAGGDGRHRRRLDPEPDPDLQLVRTQTRVGDGDHARGNRLRGPRDGAADFGAHRRAGLEIRLRGALGPDPLRRRHPVAHGRAKRARRSRAAAGRRSARPARRRRRVGAARSRPASGGWNSRARSGSARPRARAASGSSPRATSSWRSVSSPSWSTSWPSSATPASTISSEPGLSG